MRPPGHFGARVGAITIGAGLLALMTVALPTGARAASPGTDPGAKIVPAVQYADHVTGPVQYAEHVAGQLTTAASASTPVTPQPSTVTDIHRGRVVPVPVAAPQPAPASPTVPYAAISSAPPSQRTLSTHAPSPDSSAVAVASPVGGADHSRSDPTPPGDAANRSASLLGSPPTGGDKPSAAGGSAPVDKPLAPQAARAGSAPVAGPVAPQTAGTATVADGGRPGPTSNPSPATVASLLVRQMQADIASVSWPQLVLGSQPSAAVSLGPQLQGLIERIQMSVRDRQASNVFVVPPPAGSPATQLESAVTPAVSTRPVTAQRPGPQAGQEQSNRGVQGSRTPWALARVDAAFTSAASVRPRGQSVEPSLAPAAHAIPSRQRLGKARSAPRSTSRAVSSSVTVSGAPPVPTSGPAGAAASGSSGVGVGAAAAALLAAAALWLLQALLPGRLGLDLSPWQSTMLALRLERPG